MCVYADGNQWDRTRNIYHNGNLGQQKIRHLNRKCYMAICARTRNARVNVRENIRKISSGRWNFFCLVIHVRFVVFSAFRLRNMVFKIKREKKIEKRSIWMLVSNLIANGSFYSNHWFRPHFSAIFLWESIKALTHALNCKSGPGRRFANIKLRFEHWLQSGLVAYIKCASQKLRRKIKRKKHTHS